MQLHRFSKWKNQNNQPLFWKSEKTKWFFSKPKKPDNDTENDTDNEIDNDTENEIDTETETENESENDTGANPLSLPQILCNSLKFICYIK